MSGNAAKRITVHISGIRYEEFAKVKWRLFLRIYTVVLVVLVLAMVIGMAAGRLPGELPLTGILAVALILAAMLALFRGSIKAEYRRSGFSALRLTYSFDRDGWSVKSEGGQASVSWSDTWKVQRNQNALLLYPSRKSVNIVPLRNLTAEELSRITGWCGGKK